MRDRLQKGLVVDLGVSTDGRGGDGEACALREAELNRLHRRSLGPHEFVVEGEHFGAVLGSHLVMHVVLEPAHVPPLAPLVLCGARILGAEHRVVVGVREAERGGEGGGVEGGSVDEEGTLGARLEVVGEGDALVEVAAAAAVALVAKRGLGSLREYRPVGERVVARHDVREVGVSFPADVVQMDAAGGGAFALVVHGDLGLLVEPVDPRELLVEARDHHLDRW